MRTSILVFIFILTQSLNIVHSVRAETKPNVILVLVDDMGWMDLSCQGSDFYRTPNVDRLAKEGIRFTNGYAACAVCSPTRAAVQTGRYPHRLGVTDWIRSLFQRGGLGTPEKSNGICRQQKPQTPLPSESLLDGKFGNNSGRKFTKEWI